MQPHCYLCQIKPVGGERERGREGGREERRESGRKEGGTRERGREGKAGKREGWNVTVPEVELHIHSLTLRQIRSCLPHSSPWLTVGLLRGESPSLGTGDCCPVTHAISFTTHVITDTSQTVIYRLTWKA